MDNCHIYNIESIFPTKRPNSLDLCLPVFMFY